MQGKHLLSVSAFCCVLLSLGKTARADNLISNPNFVAAPANGYPGYGPVTNWTAPTLAGSYPYLSGSNTSAGPFFNNGTLPAGDNTVGFIQVYTGSGSANPTNYLRQNFAATIGQTYTISYLLDSRAGYAAPNVSVEVLGAGSALDYLMSTSIVSGGFQFFTGTFVASSSLEGLEFLVNQPAGSNDSTLLVSGVSVSSTAVTPEPSSLILMGTGVLGLAGAMRRRFSKSV